MIFLDDNRNYSPVIELWVRKFRETMMHDASLGNASVGDSTGQKPSGVKIIFDGYGENDNGTSNIQDESYVVFVHEDSLRLNEFPEHEMTPWGVVHRPIEEVSIFVWYNSLSDKCYVIPFEDNYGTEMKKEKVYKLIAAIHERYLPSL